MNSSKWLQKLLLLGVALIIVLVSGCGKNGDDDDQGTDIPPSETPTEKPVTEEPLPGSNTPPIESGPTFAECPQPDNSFSFSSGGAKNGYVDGQIIFTGVPDEIDFVVDEFGEYFETTESMATIDLRPVGDSDLDLEIRLYLLNLPVWTAVQEINLFVAATDDIQFVFAEPNYVTSLPVSGFPAAGGSGGIGGDPAAGGSGGIGGDPISDLNALEYGKKEFLNQWAFSDRIGGNASVGLYGQSNNWAAKNSSGENYIGQTTDKNIEIAVFDTVPAHYPPGRKYVDWASVPFDLCIWKPGLMIAPDENSSERTDEFYIDKQEHGLFVTGLAQGVAPAARYFLIESLNAEAQGDVVSLLFGINEYAIYRRDANNGNLNNTVINLSMGLEFENYPDFDDDEAQNALEILREVINQADWVYSQELSERTYPSVALKMALTAYEEEGAMIVAAAGNDSKELIQIPAGFSNVLGVSSNNIEMSRSCFSNYGDVAAPGGEGKGESCEMNLFELCAAMLSKGEIETIGACPYAVISIISHNPALNSGIYPSPGFGYWAGTSMSSPMVSGLVALVFEKCVGITPAQVRAMIKPIVSPNVSIPVGLGQGVINVAQTISAMCP